MRNLIFSKLSTDSELLTMLGNADYIYSFGAVELSSDGTPVPKSFIVLRYGSPAPGVGPVKRNPLTVYVHDSAKKGYDYTLIDSILMRVRKVLLSIIGEHDSSGGWITKIDWNGDSDDLTDFGYGTITKNGTFTAIASLEG